MSTSPGQRLLSRLPALEVALVLAATAFALAFHLRLPGKLVAEADYLAVQKVLVSQAQPGDVVLLYPWWTERARIFVPETLPVVGYLGSDSNPLEQYPRIWLLSQPRLPRSDEGTFLAQFSPARERMGEPLRFGNLQLSLFKNGRSRPLRFSAASAVAAARVWLEGDQGRTECPYDGRMHRCPDGRHVAAEWHEVKYEQRRCLWMPPPGGNTRLVAELSGVPAEGALTLEAGFTWDRGAFKEPRLTPVKVRLEDGATGGTLAELVLQSGQEGLRRSEVPAGRVAAPATLRLSVQSANPELRDVCVDLFAWGAQ